MNIYHKRKGENGEYFFFLKMNLTIRMGSSIPQIGEGGGGRDGEGIDVVTSSKLWKRRNVDN